MCEIRFRKHVGMRNKTHYMCFTCQLRFHHNKDGVLVPVKSSEHWQNEAPGEDWKFIQIHIEGKI